MLSYRHAFHAGNHADVLKHFVQMQLHAYLNQKDTAYSYIDTHSGAGVYALDSNWAAKNAEFETGIAMLWDRKDLPPELADYVNLVRQLNPNGRLRYYPGSPWVAEHMCREQDRLRLFELHPADFKVLNANFRKREEELAAQGERSGARGKRVLVEHGDGFQALKSLLPPPSRRALVLIDPPYEVKLDYKSVRDTLEDALKRFPGGTYAIWYPVLARMESRQFADRLKRLPAKDWLNVTLTTSTPSPDGFGLHSSGMFILNPPYTLEPLLTRIMPYLTNALGRDGGASFHLDAGTQVTGAMPVGPGSPGRMPVGNARRASPTSGLGSLRMPGQRMIERSADAEGGESRGSSRDAGAQGRGRGDFGQAPGQGRGNFGRGQEGGRTPARTGEGRGQGRQAPAQAGAGEGPQGGRPAPGAGSGSEARKPAPRRGSFGQGPGQGRGSFGQGPAQGPRGDGRSEGQGQVRNGAGEGQGRGSFGRDRTQGSGGYGEGQGRGGSGQGRGGFSQGQGQGSFGGGAGAGQGRATRGPGGRAPGASNAPSPRGARRGRG